jgi:hypothetical protein
LKKIIDSSSDINENQDETHRDNLSDNKILTDRFGDTNQMNSSTALSRARDRISTLTLLVSTTEEKNKMMEIEVFFLFILKFFVKDGSSEGGNEKA